VICAHVQTELDEWSGHADQFTLYEGFALLESVGEIPQADKFITERISPNLRLVRIRKRCIKTWKLKAAFPYGCTITWTDSLPEETVISVFPKKSVEDELEAIIRLK